MSVSLREIELVSGNPAHFKDAYQWRIRLDVHEHVPDDLEFKAVWAGSSRTNANDQILEDCEVGPLALGANELVLEHDAPDWRRIPPEDLLEVTFLVIQVSYHGQEFLRVSHFVNVAMQPGERMEPMQGIHMDRVCRNVLVAKPQIKVTAIDWAVPGDDSMSGVPSGGFAAASAAGASRASAATAMMPVDDDSRMATDSRPAALSAPAVLSGDAARGPPTLSLPCPALPGAATAQAP